MKRIIAALFVLLGLSAISYAAYVLAVKEMDGVPELLHIELKGKNNVTIKYGEEFKDPGATASYDDKDLTKDIKISKNLDLTHIGIYGFEYKIKYKKQEKEVKRTVTIIDDVPPEIKLNGREKYVIATGREFEDKGATATDNYDGDLTKKIVVDKSALDINKVGTYKIKYSIKDSSGNEASVEREIEVRQAGGEYQKIPVLNYHFFYEESEKNICTESICEHMDRFREQLNYLRDNGFYPATMNEFVRWIYGEIPLPEKTVLITVDDGAYGTGKNNGNHLIPTLEQYKMDATLFLATGWWDIEQYRSDYLQIESHTHNLHDEGIASCSYRSKLNCISYDEVLADLRKSIDVIKSTDAFCFPFYEPSETSLRAVKDAGFRVAFIGGWSKASRYSDKYNIPRYPIHDSLTIDQFKYIVN